MQNSTIHRETHFEQYITRKLEQLEKGGWVVSQNDNGFDPNTALYWDDFIAYQRKINPDKMKKMESQANWEVNLRNKLIKILENDGTILALRNGFDMAGYQHIDCSEHFPDDPRVVRDKVLYEENILRVMRQVHYQTAGQKSLDLVFFINGIPVATAEVKTELTQTVQDAIEEYQNERKPIEPGTRRKNYLLMYKRGAVVHFAISEDEIFMCTDLTPAKPRFLPFNRGNNGHAGNPPMEQNDTDYPTGYFWNEILVRENWLHIFHSFIFEEEFKKEDMTGRITTSKTQIFPRYHQWDCVTRCMADVRKNGIGQKYLIEHSAGSGKTETITWIAHEMASLRDENGNKMVDTVIVVTDRVNLDNNIKSRIKQLRKTVGLIEMIGGDDVTRKSGAKSKQLAQAFVDGREIVIVTLQVFPHALEAIATNKKLKGKNFAVLIDEAHSSQTGTLSKSLKASLHFASSQSFVSPDDTMSDEDIINAYFAAQQSSHVMPKNVSFFAFTATPKAETKTMFGREGTRVDKNGNPIPESFHLYPMRQAIEEGFILDVLLGYMPYSTAYRLKEDIVKDTMVDVKKAKRTIAMWKTLHPTNVMEKTEFIIEHFMKNVSSMLNGEAKAMIVTASRASVVRYKYAVDAYLRAHPEYDRNKVSEAMRFKVPGEPLVAFSGKITGAECIMPEDEYLKENPFALIKRDYEYDENNINNIGSESIESAFDRPTNRLLIVADKFQTGFNQSKLCAMYIDKPIANDIEIVQTYSRLNRTFAGKDHVFIIDFVNKPETVVNAFRKYDGGAQMESAQNLDIIYDIKRKLDEADIYSASELDKYKDVRYKAIATFADESKRDYYRMELYKVVMAPATRWNSARHAEVVAQRTWMDYKQNAKQRGDKHMVKQAEAELAQIEERLSVLEDFRSKLKKYNKAYNFISQIIDLGDPDLEVFNGFATLLLHALNKDDVEDIDIRNLVLSDYRINEEQNNVDETGNTVLRPMRTGGKAKIAKQESLKVIISKINEVWGNDIDPVAGAIGVNMFADRVSADDVSRIQIANSTNSKESVIESGRLENIIKIAAMELVNSDMTGMSKLIMNDPQAWKPLAELIYDLINKGERLNIVEIKDALNNN